MNPISPFSNSIDLYASRNTNTGTTTKRADASANTGDSVSLSSMREMFETGRIQHDVASGSVTSDQATQLYAQMQVIHQQIATDMQSDGGSLSSTDAQSINQLQSQMSQQIFGTSHAQPRDGSSDTSSAI